MTTSQKICPCMIFQSTTTIKKHKVWGGILLFFICAHHFGIKHYTNFLNITKFVLKHLIATHSHFHAANFISQIISYTACFELFSSGHGHLATLNFGSDSTQLPFKICWSALMKIRLLRKNFGLQIITIDFPLIFYSTSN